MATSGVRWTQRKLSGGPRQPDGRESGGDLRAVVCWLGSVWAQAHVPPARALSPWTCYSMPTTSSPRAEGLEDAWGFF